MYFLVLVYLLLYIKLDFKVYLRQNTPDLASFSRRGRRATEARPGVRPSGAAQRRAGDRRRAGEQAMRASGGAWRRWKCERSRWPERGRFKRGGGPSAGWFGGSSLPPDHPAVRLKNRRFNWR